MLTAVGGAAWWLDRRIKKRTLEVGDLIFHESRSVLDGQKITDGWLNLILWKEGIVSGKERNG